MFDDPIVAEVRAARAAFAARFDNDLAAICAELRRLERESGRTVVSFPPRRLDDDSVADVAQKPGAAQ